MSGHVGGVLLSCAAGGASLWQGNGEWQALHLLEHTPGTVVASCDKDLAFLRLYHGNRPVPLDEAEALLAIEPSSPKDVS